MHQVCLKAILFSPNTFGILLRDLMVKKDNFLSYLAGAALLLDIHKSPIFTNCPFSVLSFHRHPPSNFLMKKKIFIEIRLNVASQACACTAHCFTTAYR